MKKFLWCLLLALTFSTPARADLLTDIRSAVYTSEFRTVTENQKVEVQKAIVTLCGSDFSGCYKFTQTNLSEVSDAVVRASAASGVDWKLILSIMYVESKLCLYVKGDKDSSLGCMQIHTYWWGRELSRIGINKDDLLNKRINIIVGAFILKSKIDQYGFHNGIKRYNGSGQAAEQYYKKVMSVYGKIK